MESPLPLSGKRALITGGGTGIGAATARLMARQGARVIICGRRKDQLKETANAILGSNGTAEIFPLDVTVEAQIATLVDHLGEQHGQLDILVNNAGLWETGNLTTTSPEDFDRVLGVNLKAPFLVTKALLPFMRERTGVILNVASTLGIIAIPDSLAYTTAKGGLIAMTKAMALDLAPRGIRVNAVCPAVVETPMVTGRLEGSDEAETRRELLDNVQPIGRMGKPHEIAALLAFLASDEASFITGAAYPIDGGATAQG